ncbi:MAG TPA: hypothetical protein VLU47_11490, partial [Blastocatellia bacterium]|nr:hypothetical protein [Blastocatellia bacterium]
MLKEVGASRSGVRHIRALGIGVFVLLIGLGVATWASQRTKGNESDAEWPAYGRDAGGSRYSPLSEINRDTVKNLKVAWTYRTGATGVTGRSARNAAFEATPILVNGTLYLTTP